MNGKTTQDQRLDYLVEAFNADAEPFLACQLRNGSGIHRGVIAAGIAASAVQIALAGDAGDQERRDMFSCIFCFATLRRRVATLLAFLVFTLAILALSTACLRYTMMMTMKAVNGMIYHSQ